MKSSAGIALGVAVALTLTACGGDGDQEDLEARVADLEQQLEEAERDNDRLASELEQEREQEPESPEGPDDPDDHEEPEESGEPQGPIPAPMRTAEGLVEQLRGRLIEAGAEELPEGYEPGTTDWTDLELPEPVEGSFASAGEAVFDLGRALDADALGQDSWESTVRVLLDPDDPAAAQGVVLSWGFADDAVVGRDVRVDLERTEEDEWQLGAAEERLHCMRGVDAEQNLCM